MLKGLKVLNLPASSSRELPPELPQLLGEGNFTLKTCQRHLYLGLQQNAFSVAEKKLGPRAQIYEGEQAYHFLLKIICGLGSQLVGENEIVAQFKEAYKSYVKSEKRCTRVMKVLEKLFQDAKKIRREYLKEIGQYSYSGLTKKLLLQNRAPGPLAIVGSGQLCLDLLKVLSKRYEISVCARNGEKVRELQEQFCFTPLPWTERDKLAQYPTIVNTIGAEQTVLFSSSFFREWSSMGPAEKTPQGLFIDLGSPSVIQTDLNLSHGVYRLNDIFQEGSRMNEIKKQKVEKAKEAIEMLSQKRSGFLNVPSSPSTQQGPEGLQFV